MLRVCVSLIYPSIALFTIYGIVKNAYKVMFRYADQTLCMIYAWLTLAASSDNNLIHLLYPTSHFKKIKTKYKQTMKLMKRALELSGNLYLLLSQAVENTKYSIQKFA